MDREPEWRFDASEHEVAMQAFRAANVPQPPPDVGPYVRPSGMALLQAASGAFLGLWFGVWLIFAEGIAHPGAQAVCGDRVMDPADVCEVYRNGVHMLDKDTTYVQELADATEAHPSAIIIGIVALLFGLWASWLFVRGVRWFLAA